MADINSFFTEEGPPKQVPTFQPAPADTPTSKIDSFFSERAPVGELRATPTNPVADIGTDLWDGLTGPFRGSWHAAMGVLADPAIGFLPAAESDPNLKKAEELGWKGAAFWGSIFAGGGAATLGRTFLAKGILGGASGAGAGEFIKKLPEVVRGEMGGLEATKEIGTATAFGALFGGAVGVLPKVPGAAAATGKWAGSGVNKLIDLVPGGPKMRDGLTAFTRDHFGILWDRTFTSGRVVLDKIGLGDVRQQLEAARSTAGLIAGRWVGNFSENVGWVMGVRLPNAMAEDEIRQMAMLMIGRNMHEVTPGTAIPGFSQRIVDAAIRESRQLRAVGLRLERAGVKVFDPESGNTHTFILRKDYGIPIRYNNPDAYRAGGEFRDAARAKVAQKLQLRPDKAEEWLDAFADRLAAEQEGLISGAPVSRGGSHMMLGRSLELPGYATDLRDILPQYYEYAARRLTNHLFFSGVGKVERPVRQAVQQELFSTQAPVAESQSAPSASQIFLPGLEDFRGQGIPQEPVARRLTAAQIARARVERTAEEARRAAMIEQRYPVAFAPLERVENEAYRKLGTSIIRHQLGAIDAPFPGEGVFKKLAHIEVATKLALGAIAQPSQTLSGVVRTQYAGGMRNFVRAMANDPEAMIAGVRSGAILRSVVRHSEQSLTGGQADFLERVYFTQFDIKSRVFGAVQGSMFAQHQAQKLWQLNRAFQNGVAPRAVQNQMARIEQRLVELGIDTQAVLARGGTLSDREILLSAQKVSTDVNFWGDALSLPDFYKSPFGRYLTMFKSFGFQQGVLFKNVIAKPAARWLATDGRQGDIGPLMRFSTLTPVGGEIITDLKKLARARDPRRTDRNVAERISENIANGAGFGLAADALEATRYGLSGTLGWMTGPIGSDVAKTVTNVGGLSRGQTRNLAKQVVDTGIPAAVALTAPRLAPVVSTLAPAAANTLFPSKPRKESK